MSDSGLTPLPHPVKVVTSGSGVFEDRTMYLRRCSDPSCSNTLQYDGQTDGYVVVSSTLVFDTRLCYKHAETVAMTGTSFNGLAWNQCVDHIFAREF